MRERPVLSDRKQEQNHQQNQNARDQDGRAPQSAARPSLRSRSYPGRSRIRGITTGSAIPSTMAPRGRMLPAPARFPISACATGGAVRWSPPRRPSSLAPAPFGDGRTVEAARAYTPVRCPFPPPQESRIAYRCKCAASATQAKRTRIRIYRHARQDDAPRSHSPAGIPDRRTGTIIIAAIPRPAMPPPATTEFLGHRLQENPERVYQ